MNKEVKITVNGKTPEHNIGDHWYMVDFTNNGFTPFVRKSFNTVEGIRISKTGRVTYYDDCEYELNDKKFKERGLFWTEKEANKWIEENVPKNPKITERTYIFVVNDFTIERQYVESMKYANGAFRYKVTGENWLISEEDFGKTVFFTYEEAKVVRDKFEAELYKEEEMNE